jgi:predicted ribonuclease YlaK
MSPETVKLCAERAGQGSKVVVVGDSKQRYSVKGRKDGLRDLIEKVTQEHAGYLIPKYANVGYIRMESDNNMRSSLSKFITEIYE